MSDAGFPAMSVIIVTPDRYQTIRKTIEHLRTQTARDRLEIVIVAPSADQLELNHSELEDFFQFRLVEIGSVKSVAAAHAAGIRQARAAVVVLAEDHSYPDPGWAAALIEAHRQSWAAVGPVVRNANPDSMISWADFLIGYGRWLEPAAAGIIDHLPGHNSSYKRSILLGYGPRLEEMLEAAALLHADMQSRRHQLYLEPAAKISHVNFARLSSWLPIRFYLGRAFGATRATRWSPFHRLLYIGGAPLIPLVRLRRILREIRRVGPGHQLLPRVLPSLVAGLVADGAGELIGYAFGIGNAKQKLWNLEFHRDRRIREQDEHPHSQPKTVLSKRLSIK